ncbi:hypothetical protein PY254_16100 [Rhodanobacter sp. AS-Z3]|uniref:hypothetical protein n=1 Tax=Rhodanobacter sp. AS-Z3 TaxID=3031330 RepID=UPI0024785B0E|nr:hypothetical protein [Rhodanobacter sp. AS-Z3]WEN14735.1 hypothetical protein PY254_16100 [Rhodanobacter sp. AS-Z3]
MTWLTVKSLQRDFGLSWIASEAIVVEQIRLVRRQRGRLGVMIASLYLGGMLLAFGAIGWLLPSLPHGWQLLLRLPGFALMFFSWVVLPRLIASDAILAAAAAQAGQRSTGATI